MLFIVSVLLISFILSPSTAIKCVSEITMGVEVPAFKFMYGAAKNATTCEGDTCISYSDGANTDRDCLSGFNQTTGCWKLKELYTVCACSTDMCNSVDIKKQLKKQPPTVIPWYNCLSYEQAEGQTPTETDLSNILQGTLCEVQIYYKTTYWEISWRLPVQVNDFNTMGFLAYTPVGGVYAESQEDGDVTLSYQCRGDYCNRDFRSSWLTQREDVVCHNTDRNDTHVNCTGEFCVFYHDPLRIDVNERQSCLTMNQTNAEETYGLEGRNSAQSSTKHCSANFIVKVVDYELINFQLIGIYKTRSLTMYICKGNNCNKDLSTAQKWIENYGRGLVQAEVPVYGLPLNFENSVTGVLRKCVLVVLFYVSLN